jgi:hypothetical protein
VNDLARLQRSVDELLARERIRDLVHRYGMTVDDRDMDALADCFTPDGRFEYADGSLKLESRDAVMNYYRERLRQLGPSYHYPHSHLIWLDSTHEAHGIVAAHAELGFPDGNTVWVALRYHDRYRYDREAWRFLERRVSFLYYLKLAELPTALASPLRKRATLPHAAADWPEGLSTWKAYTSTE